MKEKIIIAIGCVLLLTNIGWVGLWSFFIKVTSQQVGDLLSGVGTLVVLVLIFPFWFFRSSYWAKAQEEYFWRKNKWVMWFILHMTLPLGVQVITWGLRLNWDQKGSVENASKSHENWLKGIYAIVLMASALGALT